MTTFLRFPLGVVAFGSGSALTIWSAFAIVFAMTQAKQGLSLPLLIVLIVGLLMLGLSLDLLKPRRASGKKEGVVAKSVWADRDEIEACHLAETKTDFAGDGGIYLGEYTDRDGRTVRLRFRGTTHLQCYGVPGSNKSAGLCTVNLGHLRRSIFVIDPKLQLAAITARKRAEFGKVIILNPFGVLADELPHLVGQGWNPILQIDADDPDFASDAECMADAMIEKSGDGGSSKFFDSSAQNLLAGLIMWERYSRGDKASLANIRALVCEPTTYHPETKEPISGFLHTLKLMSECSDHPAIAQAGARLYSRLNDKNSMNTSSQDVIDTILSNTKFLTNPNIRASMACGGRVDFAALHREVVTIYVGLPPHQLVAQAKWLRLFVNLALAELYKNPPGRDAKLPPVLFMLDEFGNLGRLSQIMSALNLARDYRIQFWMFLQNLGQLKEAYPKDWGSFFSGSGALTTFQTGDSQTQEELSKLFGNREEYVETQTANGVSIAPQAIPLIRPEDISRQRYGESINLIEPCTMPIKLRVPVYPETPWAEGLDPNPYYRGKP